MRATPATPETSPIVLVTGLVVDSQTGKPINGVTISALDGDDEERAETRSATDGHFQLSLRREHLPDVVEDAAEQSDTDAESSDDTAPNVEDASRASLYLAVSAAGYATLRVHLGPARELPPQLERMLRLERQGEIVGELLDGDGRPLAGQSVVIDVERLGDSEPETAITDQHGHFHADLTPGRYVVSARLGSDDTMMAAESVRLAPGQQARVLLVVHERKLFQLRGRAVDNAGLPFAFVRVKVKLAVGIDDPLDWILLGNDFTTAADDGSFEIDVSAERRYQIEFYAPESNPDAAPLASATLLATDGANQETIVLSSPLP